MKLQQLTIICALVSSLTLTSLAIAQTPETTTPPTTTTTEPSTQPSPAISPAQPQPQPADQTFSASQVKQIEQIIGNYLVKNPQILVKASEALQKQMLERQQSDAIKAISANINPIFQDPHSPTAGNVAGNVVMVEFFDYQCGHCKAMRQIVQSILKDNNNVKIIFKELPIFGANSTFAAAAALASVKQGKYYEFHNALLASSNPLSPEKVMAIARSVGLNEELLKKDMNSEEIKQQIRETFQLAQKLQIMGTPAFIIAQRTNGSFNKFKFIPGAVPQATLQSEINAVK